MVRLMYNSLFWKVKDKPLLGEYTSLSPEEASEAKSLDTNTQAHVSRDREVLDHSPRWELRNVHNAVIAVLILLCVVLAGLLVRSHNTSYSKAILHCGTSNTSAEARALGCEFDVLSNGWTPKQCFDNETASEFREWLQDPQRQMGAFPYFYDKLGKDRVENENKLSESFGSVVYTTQEQHLAHCTFLTRRMHRVLESNGDIRLNSRYGKLRHTKHCSEEVLMSFRRPDPRHMGGIHVDFLVSFDRC